MAKPDKYSPFDDLVQNRSLKPSPWIDEETYEPDYEFLVELINVPVVDGKGAVPTALDIWVAQELRRAGLDENAVWPRRRQPRVLSQDLVPLEAGMTEASAKISRLLAGSVEARVVGEFYEKQVDVLMAHWNRGAELMVSTKTQLGSYRKNLHNRFEEYVGDMRNLRGRFPMAALGVFHVVHSSIGAVGGAWEFTLDMMRKLQLEPQGYDATCSLMAHWDAGGSVELLLERTPADLSGGELFRKLIHSLLDRTPVTDHLRARAMLPGAHVVAEAGATHLKGNPEKAEETSVLDEETP